MKLNDKHIEILTEVRKRMENPQSFTLRFICNHLYDVTHFTDPETGVELREAIMHSLNHRITIATWMMDKVPGFGKLPAHKLQQYGHQARMAWLDRMIETRNIS